MSSVLHIIVAGALIAGVWGAGWMAGSLSVQARWDAVALEQQAEIERLRAKQQAVTTEVITEYVDRIQVVREKGETIIKEVPVYVPVQSDAACRINRGFERLHDTAAAGELPPAPELADAAPTATALSTVAGTVASNYQRCHENAEQLKALQAWLREVHQ